MNKISLAFILPVFLMCSSCKKHTSSTVWCSTLYGLTIVNPNFSGIDPASSFGTIDKSTGTISRITTLSGDIHTRQGAYNTFDHCYYVQSATGLYQVNSSGTVKSLSFDGTSWTYFDLQGLVYNQFTKKLYCLKSDISYAANVMEITINDTSYSESSLASTLHNEYWADYVSMTVDNSTGDLYYATADISPSSSIEKYQPGAAAPTLVHSSTTDFFSGLTFNKNDHMLYAIDENDSDVYYFVKIDPSSGSVTKLSALSFRPNTGCFSAVMDPCSNNYIFTSIVDTGNLSTFNLINTSGVQVNQDTIHGVFQGLAITY